MAETKKLSKKALNTVDGEIVQFLRRNLFKVRLSDGQDLVAVMLSNLLHIAVNFKHGFRTPFIAVRVELRKRPRTHRIVGARESGLSAGGR